MRNRRGYLFWGHPLFLLLIPLVVRFVFNSIYQFCNVERSETIFVAR